MTKESYTCIDKNMLQYKIVSKSVHCYTYDLSSTINKKAILECNLMDIV
jgi:hypothetical protein